MKIGDRVFVHGYIDEIRKDTVIIRNNGGYFGTIPSEVITGELPSAQPKTDEENELKFYYVESIDDYWIGQRLDNFYYADWHEGLGFVWSKSRYLPWGEHIVNEQTLWKEHTYPSEPKEIPFTMWIVGFMKKYSAEPKTGEWIHDGYDFPHGNDWIHCSLCGKRGINVPADLTNFCPSCGADMRGEGEEE